MSGELTSEEKKTASEEWEQLAVHDCMQGGGGSKGGAGEGGGGGGVQCGICNSVMAICGEEGQCHGFCHTCDETSQVFILKSRLATKVTV